jgi:hypothetical protein
MSRAVLIIDGETHIDDDLHEWHKRPPAVLADIVKAKLQPNVAIEIQPYLLAAAGVLATATAKNQPVCIIIATRPAGWTLTVDHTLSPLAVKG